MNEDISAPQMVNDNNRLDHYFNQVLIIAGLGDFSLLSAAIGNTNIKHYFDGLVQVCGNFDVLAENILQSCAEQSI